MTEMRISRLALLALVIAAAALASLYFAYEFTFYPDPPTATYPKPKDLAQAQAQDIDYARNVLTLDRSWTSETRTKADASFKELAKRTGQMTPVQFSFALAEIVALADNGHTSVQAITRNRDANRAPFRLYPFGSGMFVMRTDGANVDLLGAKLVKVEATPVEDIVARSRAFFGGLPHSRDVGAPSLLESPEQLHALGYAAKPEAARYIFRRGDGTEIERELVGVALGPKRVRAYIDRWLSPEPIEGEPSDWKSLIRPEHCPIALQEPDIPFRMKRLDDLKAVFVQFRENQDSGNYLIADFIARAKAEMRAARPENIVLDMRMNSGGDYTTTVDFMHELPSLIPGRIFVLTSPLTFSAGISSVAFLKDKGRDRVVIVGEPIGDRLISYGEGGTMSLPNSGITIRFATGLHDYKHGCHWFGPCFWVNWVYSASVESLDPDLTAPLEPQALAESRDPALEAIAAALEPPLGPAHANAPPACRSSST